MKTTTIPNSGPNSAHDPCCSVHGEPMTCEKYRRTHFVEVRPCCPEDAERLKAEDAPIPELVQTLGGATIDAGRRDRGLDTLIPTAPTDTAYAGPREPETVGESLEAVHRRFCSPGAATWHRSEVHDPVCRILHAHVRNLEAALEAGRHREPVRPPLEDGDRDGVTFAPEFDRDRLNRQARDVYDAFAETPPHVRTWWTLRELADFTGHPEASVSARIRDLRKPRFGGLTIERRRRGEGRGTWEYRLEPPCPRDHAGPCFSDPRLCAKILTDARAAQVTP